MGLKYVKALGGSRGLLALLVASLGRVVQVVELQHEPDSNAKHEDGRDQGDAEPWDQRQGGSDRELVHQVANATCAGQEQERRQDGTHRLGRRGEFEFPDPPEAADFNPVQISSELICGEVLRNRELVVVFGRHRSSLLGLCLALLAQPAAAKSERRDGPRDQRLAPILTSDQVLRELVAEVKFFKVRVKVHALSSNH